jgi:hypothetical protein
MVKSLLLRVNLHRAQRKATGQNVTPKAHYSKTRGIQGASANHWTHGGLGTKGFSNPSREEQPLSFQVLHIYVIDIIVLLTARSKALQASRFIFLPRTTRSKGFARFRVDIPAAYNPQLRSRPSPLI